MTQTVTQKRELADLPDRVRWSAEYDLHELRAGANLVRLGGNDDIRRRSGSLSSSSFCLGEIDPITAQGMRNEGYFLSGPYLWGAA